MSRLVVVIFDVFMSFLYIKILNVKSVFLTLKPNFDVKEIK